MIQSLLLAAVQAASVDVAPATSPPEAEIVITVDRTGKGADATQVGGSVTILSAETLERRQARQLSDVLRDVPGVAVSGTPGLSQVRLRGAEANHTLVLIDGIEVSDPFFGEFDFSGLQVDEASRVEVLRGPQSALYGSDAIGGVVQYLTAGGRENPGLSVRAEAGSFETLNGAMRAGGASGELDYAITSTLQRTGGAPNARGGSRDLESTSTGVSTKLGWQPAAELRLSGVLRYAKLKGDYNLSNADPGSSSFGQIIDTPRTFLENDAVYGLSRGEWDLLDGRWGHTLSAQFAKVSRDTFSSGERSSGNEGSRVKASYDTSLKLGSGSIRHRLSLASDIERESFRNTDPSGFAFTGRRHVKNTGLVGQYTLLLSDFGALSASVRHDLNSRFADATTYRFQASARLASGTRFRGAAGSGIKNPGIFELFGFVDGQFLGNPDLKPEKSRSWEVGIDQDLAGRKRFGATYFQSHLHDEIAFAFLPGLGFVGANRSDISRQRGVELFANVPIIGGWRVDGAYTYLKARENGRDEVRRPRHVGSLTMDYHPTNQRWGTTIVARYHGRAEDNAFILPPFGSPVRVDLKAHLLINWNADLRLSQDIDLFARAENLLNKTYEQVFSFRSPGRAVYTGLRWRR